MASALHVSVRRGMGASRESPDRGWGQILLSGTWYGTDLACLALVACRSSILSDADWRGCPQRRSGSGRLSAFVVEDSRRHRPFRIANACAQVYFEAQLTALESGAYGFDTVYLNPRNNKAELLHVLRSKRWQFSFHLQIHDQDAEAVASRLAKRGCRSCITIPADSLGLLQGLIGSWWEVQAPPLQTSHLWHRVWFGTCGVAVQIGCIGWCVSCGTPHNFAFCSGPVAPCTSHGNHMWATADAPHARGTQDER